jgi:hypothetical protein
MRGLEGCQQAAPHIEACYSKARFSVYVNLEAYCYDIELSESFYPALRTLEIVLRNSLWNAITSTLKNKNWLIDSSVLLEQEKKIVVDTQEKIKRYYPTRTQDIDHLISELSFGFWNNLLNLRYEQIFWPQCLKLFSPYISRTHRYRDFLHKRLQKIRKLRNRIFHHQRISHMKNIAEQHTEILEVISWIEPKILQHLKSIDRFQLVYQKRLKIFYKEPAKLCLEITV